MLPGEEVKRIDEIIAGTRKAAAEVEILYVTNLIDGKIEHYSNTGLSMSSQYYYESEVSNVIQALESIGLSVRPFYSEIEFITWITSDEFKVSDDRWRLVVTTAEGGEGEGRRALIPSFCNLVGLACWNSPAHGSSVARHKFHANKILSACGMKVPRTWFYSFNRKRWLNHDLPEIGAKLIIKPAWESGSKGVDDDSIFIADNKLTERVAARSTSFGQSCIVQEFKTGYEIGVPIVAIPETTAAGLIGFSDGDKERYGSRARTFSDEKIVKSAKNFPFHQLCSHQEERVLRLAERAFDALSMKGLGRIDMRIDEDGEGWIFDTNESPPPLPRSSFIQLFNSLGYSYEDALSLMIGVNLKRFGRI